MAMPTATGTEATMPADATLLRLLQLVSPALPVGAYAWSAGLEQAVEQGWVHDEASAGLWILGLLGHVQARVDVPVLVRLHRAWNAGDGTAVNRWNAYLYACRESAELRAEDRHLGNALARLLLDLDVEAARPWRQASRTCFATPFALAAAHWGIDPVPAAQGYLWAWTENQVAAATRLVPLGQTAGQRLLSSATGLIPQVVATGVALDNESLGASAPGQALASTLHETQYSRLFRS